MIALSSANLYSAVQPGGSLYGLQASNPVETDVAYGNGPGNSPPANAFSFGSPNDPLVGGAPAASMYSAAALRSI